MDLRSQLQAAGVDVIDGNMRMLAALSNGSAISVLDQAGSTYELSLEQGRIRLKKHETPDQSPAAMVRIGRDVSVWIRSFSFRAETESDAVIFLDAVKAAGHGITYLLYHDTDGMPDIEVDLQSDAALDQLQAILRQIIDSHVMLQTLRPVPLAANSLERDYDL